MYFLKFCSLGIELETSIGIWGEILMENQLVNAQLGLPTVKVRFLGGTVWIAYG